MKNHWKYLDNQFLTVTRNNYKKAIKISNYHDADLEAKQATEPLLIPIYDRYHLLHVNLIKAYSNWRSAGGSQGGQTLNLEQLLDLALSKLQQWEVQVQAAATNFMKGKPDYKTIFPKGRKVFTRSSMDDRINAYNTLATNMAPFAPLAAIKLEVEAVYASLDAARDAQQSAKGTVKNDSGSVETARIDAMTMQWRNLGFCMDNFWKNPDYIESMFDLQTLREGPQRIFTGTLDHSENEAVLIHTFLADDELRLKSNGNATIHFYLSNVPNGINSTPVVVGANLETTIPASTFLVPDYHKYKYLTAVNQSPTETTQYVVEVI